MKSASQKSQNTNLKKILKASGYSISGWARANGFVRGSVEYALTNRRNGKLSREIRTKVENLKG